jgi:hypothetical protein
MYNNTCIAIIIFHKQHYYFSQHPQTSLQPKFEFEKQSHFSKHLGFSHIQNSIFEIEKETRVSIFFFFFVVFILPAFNYFLIYFSKICYGLSLMAMVVHLSYFDQVNAQHVVRFFIFYPYALRLWNF